MDCNGNATTGADARVSESVRQDAGTEQRVTFAFGNTYKAVEEEDLYPTCVP